MLDGLADLELTGSERNAGEIELGHVVAASANTHKKGRDRIPALKNRRKAPLLMMPCRMPSLVRSSALLSSETKTDRQKATN